MRTAPLLRISCVAVLTCVLWLDWGCSPSTSAPGISSGGCTNDADCPSGEECSPNGCVPSAPTLYPHIQLASALFRTYLDNTEITWRATHNDLLIGRVHEALDMLRAANPNANLFDYFTVRYNVYQRYTEPWATDHGYDVEDFYLHYQEDVSVPEYSYIVLVPGWPPGVIPGWNPDRQPGDPPATATERWQSRILGANGPTSYMCNISDPGYRYFLHDFTGPYDMFTGKGPIEGYIADHGVYYPQFNEGLLDKTVEFYGIPLDENHPYPLALESFYTEHKRTLDSRYGVGFDVMPNYGHTSALSLPDRFSQDIQDITGWAWGEVWMSYRGGNSPTSGSNRVILYDYDYEKGIANIVRQTRAGGRRMLGARDLAGGIDGTDRGHIYTLALYYLVHNRNTFYAFETVESHVEPVHISSWQWNPAVEYDIGRPAPVPAGFVDFEGKTGTTEHYILASGPDPADTTKTYHVLARKFTNGMVLAKMLPKGSAVDGQSATTHALDRVYAVLLPDGTPGQYVNQVTLRNNEGVILVDPQ